MKNQSENGYEHTFTTIGYTYLKMNNMLRFKYPIGRLQVYSNVGISNGFAIKEINYRKKETKLYAMERVVEDKAINDTRKYEQGYLLGLGIILKKYNLEIRYEKGNGMSDYNGLKSSTSRFNFLLGYRF